MIVGVGVCVSGWCGLHVSRCLYVCCINLCINKNLSSYYGTYLC